MRVARAVQSLQVHYLHYGGALGVLVPQRLSKRVIALWLVGKSMKNKDSVRLAMDGLGTVGSVLG